MTDSAIPRSPLDNPLIVEGIYLATIREVECGTDTYASADFVQLVFWLPEPQVHLLTNFCFPRTEEGRRSMQRLVRLCRLVGLTPPLNSPGDLLGRKIAVKVKVFTGVGSNREREYLDVESFLPADAVTAEEKVTV